MSDDGWQEDFVPGPATNNYQEPRKYSNHVQDSSSGPTEEVVLKIADGSVGRIIGPRGTTIKDLQTTYNVQISIAKHENSDK